MGDSAAGYPGWPGWGAVSAATVLARYRHLERVPAVVTEREVSVRGALRRATLREDAPIAVDVDALRFTSARPSWPPPVIWR